MFTKLLVPLDNSRLAEQALPTAEWLARRQGAALELVYVHEPHAYGGYTDSPWNAARRSSEDSYVHAMAEEVHAGADVTTRGAVVTGRPATAICARATQARADLIVMTTHGHSGISRAWLGSVADAVVREADVPVLMLRAVESRWNAASKRVSFKRILVPLDGSPASESILPAAASLARADAGRLILLEIVPPVPIVVPDVMLTYSTGPTIADPDATAELVRLASRRLHAAATRMTAEGVLSVEAHVVVSDYPAQAVCDATRAHAADVIAMTTSGHGASRLVVGSVADKVMRACQLPLLLHRPFATVARAEAFSSANDAEAVTA